MGRTSCSRGPIRLAAPVRFVPIGSRLAPAARERADELRQSIRLTKSADGTAIAWAEAGTGPSLVKASNWLTHLEHETESPVWRHWVRFFASHYRFVRYDERGCGMSERDIAELSIDRAVEDLEAVIAAARPREPFVLVGVSQGGAAAIRYAVANPGKVSHLVLYGAYAQGRAMQHDRAVEEAQRARIALTRTGWGQNNPVYRQLFTSRFIPGATDEQIRWFNDLCKITATAEMAARIMEFRLHIDVTSLLPQVSVPTLVLHARSDEAVSAGAGATARVAYSGRDARRARFAQSHFARDRAGLGALQGRSARVHGPAGRPRRRRAILEPIAARARDTRKNLDRLHEHRYRPTALHQREDGAQSRHADFREARREFPRSGDRACEGPWAARGRRRQEPRMSQTAKLRASATQLLFAAVRVHHGPPLSMAVNTSVVYDLGDVGHLVLIFVFGCRVGFEPRVA